MAQQLHWTALLALMFVLFTALALSVEAQQEQQQHRLQQQQASTTTAATTQHRQQQHKHHSHQRQHHHLQQQQQQQQPQQRQQQQPPSLSKPLKLQSARRQRRLEALSQLHGTTVVAAAAAAAAPLPLPDAQVELLPNGTRGQQQPQQQTLGTATQLRRLSARDYYNNVVQRRLNTQHRNQVGGHSEWDYHVYNVHSNTFEAPTAAAAATGKGDDNTGDVEFISHTDWPNGNRRGFGYQPARTTTAPPTRAPPPLVPARRGYVTTAPVSGSSSSGSGNVAADMPQTSTEAPHDEAHNSNSNNNNNNNAGRNYPNNDAKDMEKRHICVQQRTITMPVKTTEVYTRPIWKHVSTPCSAVQVQTTHPNQMCTRVQLVHEQSYRDVIRHKAAQQVTYDCCNGWTRESPQAEACMKPVCATRCQNGGNCVGPEQCSCPAGFTGRYCEHDINECKEEKPCDQSCINTLGSYYCKCREGFILQPDQQSCKKVDVQDDDAFEARDLENEIESGDNEDVAARLQKIERSLANERVHTNELQKSLQATYNVVDTLKSRLITLEKQQMDMNRLQTNLYATETRTNKLEGMLNLLMKCRSGPNAYCP